MGSGEVSLNDFFVSSGVQLSKVLIYYSGIYSLNRCVQRDSPWECSHTTGRCLFYYSEEIKILIISGMAFPPPLCRNWTQPAHSVRVESCSEFIILYPIHLLHVYLFLLCRNRLCEPDTAIPINKLFEDSIK